MTGMMTNSSIQDRFIRHKQVRQVFQRWAQNKKNYEEDPFCEAQRIWGALLLIVFDTLTRIVDRLWPPLKVKQD
jgi:hypothetical protein